MTQPNPVNVAASVRQRLKNVADQSGRPFAERKAPPRKAPLITTSQPASAGALL